ncbi:glutathione S-transferase family protein [Nitrogeniibacter mangrovi]|uniref:Glutathione S-transferase family protein n=1 Tax=Nitrogeniibacter mangrovi TaxID=2016596 RepID=A0A6C1B6W9_9RHOO|nr:glutathione S-transferase family protein [Nitrogeniibacter mangrovi]QID19502.1 glutathione S-transferase family protein [Nitrogeniibacter mangrovi]
MSLLKLYDKPECPFCWKVRLALHECGMAAERIDSRSPVHRPLWQALTPRKTVPVLLAGDHVIHESNVILEYLADISGRLLPANPADRIQPRQLNVYVDGVIGPALREVIFEKRDKPEAEWDPARIQAGTLAFEKALRYLSEQLGDRDFFADRYSFPECALTARFGLAEAYGVAIPDRFVNLQDWFARMKARPSYRATAP